MSNKTGDKLASGFICIMAAIPLKVQYSPIGCYPQLSLNRGDSDNFITDFSGRHLAWVLSTLRKGAAEEPENWKLSWYGDAKWEGSSNTLALVGNATEFEVNKEALQRASGYLSQI